MVSGIPRALVGRPQWVCWHLRPGPDGKWTKVPVQPRTGLNASTTNPTHWGTFEEAIARQRRDSLSGVGFVLTADDPFVFIDLDHCYDPETNELDEWARAVSAQFGETFQEISVSRTGVHIFVMGKIPAGMRRKKVVVHPSARAGAAIEMYETGRYATVSGIFLNRPGAEILAAQEAIDATCARYLSVPLRTVPTATVAPAAMDIADRLERARSSAGGSKFRALYDEGSTALHGGDRSAADLALCCILAFWLDRDPDRIDDAFRRSALMRDKWVARRGQSTYGRYTIDKALDLVGDSFGSESGTYFEIPDPVIAQVIADDDEWPGDEVDQEAPEPGFLAAPPPFPMDALPTVAREFVRVGGLARGNTPDFVAVPLLACVGAVVGHKIRVRIKQGFEEHATGWFTIVGQSGTAKSASVSYAMSGLYAIQEHYRQRYELDLMDWQNLDKKEREARSQPKMRSIFTTDATMEAVAEMLSLRNGLVIVADELTAWMSSFDAYRKGGGDRQKWLTMESGGTIKVDRRTGPSFFVQHPACSVIGGTQPDRLSDIRADGADDGFAQRLLICYPEANVPRLNRQQEDDTQVIHDMVAIFDRLNAIPDMPHVVTFSADAYAALDQWDEENAAIIEQSSGLARGWASKAVKSLARVALILHCLTEDRPHQTQISAETVGRAIDIVEYFRSHFIRCLPLMGVHGGVSVVNVSRETNSNAHRIFKVLKSRRLDGDGWVSRQELMRSVRIDKEQMGAALETLAGEGAIEERIEEGKGRPRSMWRMV
jgi:hypothetical protein